MVVTKNIVDSVKDRLYNIDTKNKVIKGVDVEALRCVIGRSDFDTFFGKSTNFRDDLAPEVAVQLMDPLDSVVYCRKHGYDYPKEFSGVVLKSAAGTLQSLASRIIRLRPVGLDVLSKTKPLWDYHRGFYINKGVTSAVCLPTSVCACVTHKCILFLCHQTCHHIHLMFYVFCFHYVL